MATDEEVEAAAEALYAAEKARRVKIGSIFGGSTATEVIEPYAAGADDTWRANARAALLAAEVARKPDAGPLLPPDWLQREVEKVRDEPPVESWFRLATPLPMPPYEYQMQHVGAAKAYSGQDLSPSPEHPVDDDALVRRLDGLPQP
jgi:hypothetical protein